MKDKLERLLNHLKAMQGTGDYLHGYEAGCHDTREDLIGDIEKILKEEKVTT